MTAQETAPAHVFGYSMGGYAALLAARQAPARFASLTTLGTKLDWSSESAAAETRRSGRYYRENKYELRGGALLLIRYSNPVPGVAPAPA